MFDKRLARDVRAMLGRGSACSTGYLNPGYLSFEALRQLGVIAYQPQFSLEGWKQCVQHMIFRVVVCSPRRPIRRIGLSTSMADVEIKPS